MDRVTFFVVVDDHFNSREQVKWSMFNASNKRCFR